MKCKRNWSQCWISIRLARIKILTIGDRRLKTIELASKKSLTQFSTRTISKKKKKLFPNSSRSNRTKTVTTQKLNHKQHHRLNKVLNQLPLHARSWFSRITRKRRSTLRVKRKSQCRYLKLTICKLLYQWVIQSPLKKALLQRDLHQLAKSLLLPIVDIIRADLPCKSKAKWNP